MAAVAQHALHLPEPLQRALAIRHLGCGHRHRMWQALGIDCHVALDA